MGNGETLEVGLLLPAASVAVAVRCLTLRSDGLADRSSYPVD